jgi:hypothetical protein
MKITLFTLATMATSALGLKVVLGEVHEFCYTNLDNSCVVYHTNAYADGFNRIYVPDNLVNN